MCQRVQSLSVQRHFIINHCPGCKKIYLRHYSFMLTFSYREFKIFAKQSLRTSFSEEAVDCSGQEQLILSAKDSDIRLCLIETEFIDLKRALKEATGNLHISQSLFDTNELRKDLCLN